MADIHWNYKEFKMEKKEREKEMETWARFIAELLKTGCSLTYKKKG